LAGTKHRFSGLSHPRQCGEDVLRISTQVDVYSAPRTLGFFEQRDALALLAWFDKDRLIARLDAALDEEADDAIALNDVDRAKQEATILGDIVSNDRNEVALIELAAKQKHHRRTPPRRKCASAARRRSRDRVTLAVAGVEADQVTVVAHGLKPFRVYTPCAACDAGQPSGMVRAFRLTPTVLWRIGHKPFFAAQKSPGPCRGF
jgi:hypothetical protein